ncbi:type IV-A pilus assembly ATPase PilB [Legionella fairfieldensis]|uniref:type IV-A pilus assembly ATPase PilB n=1 Tax=Legionella fairfieldensis TaxID=45064 RepID=UPI000490A57D|nr:type IV-A pilus assembly ATPase PilB [Legionella fairfieldensis]
MLTIAERQSLQGISQLLVQANFMDKNQASRYQQEAALNQQSILRYLVTTKLFSATNLARILAQYFNLPLINLDEIDFDSIPAQMVSDKLIHRHQVLPLFIRDHYLFLAIDDPFNEDALKEIQFHTGLQTRLFVAETDKLEQLINTIFPKNQNNPLLVYLENIKNEQSETYDDAPVINFVNQILLEAISKGASDIHCEPYDNNYRIRYRQDGLLTGITALPKKLAARINARIKIMANLNIAEHRLPQDGRFQMTNPLSKTIDLRVSTCPTIDGEKIVLRILDPGSLQLAITTLGLNNLQEKLVLTALGKPQGFIIVTGPTGSGKTVSLYTALSILNSIERNISTVEDPVELKMPGINQVNVNPKIGLTFSNALRSLLRQDPDTLMIGEIRDPETAEIATKAAQTGHLVLSTLHTNSAAETLTRLHNLGIPLFNIAHSVSLLIAQRLARRLCDVCKKLQKNPPQQHLMELGYTKNEVKTSFLYQAQGCDQCTNGYKGRIGLFEVLPVSKTISQLIISGVNSPAIHEQAQKEGMLTLWQSGLEKVKQGLTTLEEINRVLIN